MNFSYLEHNLLLLTILRSSKIYYGTLVSTELYTLESNENNKNTQITWNFEVMEITISTELMEKSQK